MKSTRFCGLCLAGLLSPLPLTALPQAQDGHLFDPGVAMLAPASGAPAETAKLSPLLGSWNVEFSTPIRGTRELRSQLGVAHLTWMNRGHGLMERVVLEPDERDPRRTHLMAFHAFAPASGTWGVGESSSATLAIEVFHGGFEGEQQVLRRAFTTSGGLGTTLERRTLTFEDDGSFTVLFETSTDFGSTYLVDHRRKYTPRNAEALPSPGYAVVGKPAATALLDPACPSTPFARQFDFLLGEFDATHWMRFPNGQEARWKSHATAVHALGGHGILEFNHFDTDPSLPDAATSILRVFNPAQRRWESLYVTNRGNSLLHFGGVKEGEQIVLHGFAVDATAPLYSQWIFFDVAADTYRWKALTSTDGGATQVPTWTIDFERKPSLQQRNHAVWEKEGARLREEAPGRWVLIADGALLGHYADFQDALAVAQFSQRDRSHAYLYRAGVDDLPLEFALSPFLSEDPHWCQIGFHVAREWELSMAAAGNVWSRAGKEVAWGDGEAQAQFSPPLGGTSITEAAVVSAMLKGDVTLRPSVAAALQLEGFRSPVPAYPHGNQELPCRRVPVRIQFPQLGIDSILMAIVLPEYADGLKQD